MDEPILEQFLQQLQVELKYTSNIGLETPVGVKLHRLAEARYTPALPVMRALLAHPDWSVRLEAVRLIGFHFDFSANSLLAQEIRQLLLHDPAPMVRITSANVLAGRSTWPDSALTTALTLDTDDDVRQAAFLAILELCGVDRGRLHQVEQQIDRGELVPTPAAVQRILSEQTGI